MTNSRSRYTFLFNR